MTSVIDPAAGTAGRYDRLIRHDKVHGSMYTDPTIFADELNKIWYRSWVFVGHESEVARPGDYVRKKLGLQDVIMTRDRDGQVHLLLNRCSHRGNQVCDDAKGNSSTFRCPFHGWTFRNTGELIGFPFFKGGYGQRQLDMPMGRVPRMDSYRGFVFGSFAAEGPTLLEHLGAAAGEIDRLCGLSPGGHRRAERRVAAASDPGQLETGGGERDRWLPPAIRARCDPRRHTIHDRTALQ